MLQKKWWCQKNDFGGGDWSFGCNFLFAPTFDELIRVDLSSETLADSKCSSKIRSASAFGI